MMSFACSVVCGLILLSLFYKSDSNTNTMVNFSDLKDMQNEESQKLRRKPSCDPTVVHNLLFSGRLNHSLIGQLEVWNGCDVLNHVNSKECQWQHYRSTNPSLHTSSAEKAKICLYPTPDQEYINHVIKNTGTWPDCSSLVNLYNKHKHPGGKSFYVEIGNSYGQCIFDMLLSTDATIVAFKTNAIQLYQLTSSLMTLPKEMRRRVALYHNINLSGHLSASIQVKQGGDKSSDRNVKNTLQDWSKSEELLPLDNKAKGITTTTLDDVFENILLSSSSSLFDISLLKLDAPGMECDIIRGAKHVLSHTQAVLKTYEVDGTLSATTHCSTREWKNQFSNVGLNNVKDMGLHTLATTR